MNYISIKTQWQVGVTNNKDTKPQETFSAKVPGSAQADYIKEHKITNLFFETNTDIFRQFEDSFWVYSTNFSKPDFSEKEDVIFSSKGIDHEFEIVLNGKTLLHQTGMYTPVRIVLNEFLQDENTLEIVIFPIPKVPGKPEGREEAILTTKPACSYSWDWHPRLVPSGVFDETEITIEPQQKIVDVEVSYTISENLETANISLQYEIENSQDLQAKWQLFDDSNNCVLENSVEIIPETFSVELELQNPKLWWPHDHGSQNLYVWKLELSDSKGNLIDSISKKIGFRKVELVMSEGTWTEPIRFPKSRSVAPFQLRINNKNIFGKGTNWVHPDIFYHTFSKELYHEQLTLLKGCNMNIIRVWGGGIINKDSFFELCDEMGIMVWQEFPLACNNYPNDVIYLDLLERESTFIIKNVKPHPCLVLWSGGNELFNNWSGMTDQSHALRLLNSLCYEQDRHTPFIPTSPIFGVAHGHYLFFDNFTQLDVFELMHNAENTAYTEFGMPSLANVDVLKTLIPESEIFPPTPTKSWVHHNAFQAWEPTAWLELPTLEKYFGKAKSLEELVENSQQLQSIGYKAIFEEARRQKPYCTMALNWCFAEPWPNATNNNLVGYPNLVRPAYYAVKESLRPILTSAAFAKFEWERGKKIEFDVWMLNDTYSKVPAGTVTLHIEIDGKESQIGSWDYAELAENANLQGPTIRYDIPKNMGTKLLKISTKHSSCSEYNSEYFVKIRPHAFENVLDAVI